MSTVSLEVVVFAALMLRLRLFEPALESVHGTARTREASEERERKRFMVVVSKEWEEEGVGGLIRTTLGGGPRLFGTRLFIPLLC